jgi:hypothetical protein
MEIRHCNGGRTQLSKRHVDLCEIHTTLDTVPSFIVMSLGWVVAGFLLRRPRFNPCGFYYEQSVAEQVISY